MALLIYHSIEEEGIEGQFGHEWLFGIAESESVEPGEIVADLGIEGFDGGGKRLGLDEQVRRNHGTVDLPFVGGDRERLQVRESGPELLEGFSATAAHFKGKDASRGTRHSNPHP